MNTNAEMYENSLFVYTQVHLIH